MTPPRTLPVRLVSLRVLATAGAFALAGTLAACGGDGGEAAAVHQVKAGDDSCRVDDTSLDAGRHAFKVENVGSDVTEVYVYGKDGDDFSTIMGERENIGPGTVQTLEVDLAAGDYEVACKPGMTGDGIRTALSVTGAGGSSEAAKQSYDRELEFEVENDGTVRQPSKLSAKAGERIEFKLENKSDAEYYLEVLGPDGSELGEGEAHGGQDAEFVTELADAGDYQVKVFRDGQEDKSTTLALNVTD
jgi:iron uptake system component EfeO